MPTIAEVQEQIRNIEKKYDVKLDTFGTKKEIKYLPEALYNNEVIEYLTSGFLDGSTWLLICTNIRILALDKGLIYGLKQQEIPLEKISSVSFKKKLMFAEVEIITSSSKIKIENIYKDQVENFVRAINTARENLNKSQNNSIQSSQEDVVSQIEKLAELKEKGILTEEEFSAKKKQLLGI